jgi:hypothetical protein
MDPDKSAPTTPSSSEPPLLPASLLQEIGDILGRFLAKGKTSEPIIADPDKPTKESLS